MRYTVTADLERCTIEGFKVFFFYEIKYPHSEIFYWFYELSLRTMFYRDHHR